MRLDSLELALRAVPMRHGATCRAAAGTIWLGASCECEFPDYHALAAAVRAWIRTQLPQLDPAAGVIERRQAYNNALADLALRLGL